MTVYSEENKVRYIGNGVSVDYMVTFPFMANDDGTAQLGVYLGDSDVPLKENTDYTVSGANTSEGGIVTFMTAPAKDQEIAIIRQVPNVQTVIFKNEDKFPAVIYENALDKLTMQIQEIKEAQTRAILLPPTSDEKPLDVRDDLLKARDEAVSNATAAAASATAAQQSAESAEAAKEAASTSALEAEKSKQDLLSDEGFQIVAADLAGENKIGYVAENLDSVASNVDKASEAAAAAGEAAATAVAAAENAQNTIDTAIDGAMTQIKEAETTSISVFNQNAQTQTEAFNANAAAANEESAENAEKSRIWAEGEQAEVENIGGELSSRGYADFAAAIANTPEDVPLDQSEIIAMDIIKGPKGDKGDKGDPGEPGKDGIQGDLNNPFFFGMSKYFESEPNNASWLVSNGAFHSGTIYKSFYEWLLKILNGTENVDGVSVKASTEVYGDYDYVVNTTDTTFRLPIYDGSETIISNKYSSLELGESDKSYTAPANGVVAVTQTNNAEGYCNVYAGNRGVMNYVSGSSSANKTTKVNFSVKRDESFKYGYSGRNADATSNSFKFYYAQGNGSLYFYVGETIQDANVIAAGEVLNDVATLKGYDYVVESYDDGANWYRIYKSGWIEQGGAVSTVATSNTVTYLKPFKNYPYVSLTRYSTYSGAISMASYWINGFTARSSTTFTFGADPGNSSFILWYACGQGE